MYLAELWNCLIEDQANGVYCDQYVYTEAGLDDPPKCRRGHRMVSHGNFQWRQEDATSTA